MSDFLDTSPTLDAYWRAIILFGRNTASYKFALGKSLLELAKTEKTFITLDELAEPFSRHLLEHLVKSDKQGTFRTSTFLDALKSFNSGEITRNQMLERTSQSGFVNVIDAFHIVNQAETPIRFFTDDRKSKNGITITDNLFFLRDVFQAQNLPYEVEARWRLVETAWNVGISTRLLVVKYDEVNKDFFIEESNLSRISVTSCIDALNGYQKGKCFYCYREILITECDVDHFFPHTLINYSTFFRNVNIDGVWNLVLACKDCNRGPDGKSARLPEVKYLQRLHKRNNYLIDSHHPLRETLMNQTGVSTEFRKDYLNRANSEAIQCLIHWWRPAHEYGSEF